ncbi:MAG: hypothetical protein FWC11_04775, partial [Firmicutes bacterium]|nr:hypothetical protein [Bacillota bacterium]
MKKLTKRRTVFFALMFITFGVFGAVLLSACHWFERGERTPDFNDALRAVPTATSLDEPAIIEYFTDGVSNFFIIDVGHIENMLLSTVAEVPFNGMTPVSFSRTTVNSSTITTSVTRTVSNSVKVSCTQSQTTSITAGASVSPVSLSLGRSWTSSLTNANTTTRSIETSTSQIISTADEVTIAFTVGNNNEPAGTYRLALYATVDVYLIVSTTIDNQEVLGIEPVVAARSQIRPRFEFSADGLFDNSPIDGSEIVFDENFHRYLPIPDSSVVVRDFSRLIGEEGSNLIIPPIGIFEDVMNFTIIGNPNVTHTTNIVIQPREKDLRITLQNINFAANQGTSGIRHSGTNSTPHTVTIALIGSSSVSGGVGIIGMNGNSNQGGQSGGNGGVGIDMTSRHTLVIIGGGNLIVRGGNGGDGGRGDNNNSYIADVINSTRRGGRGGNGGAAAIAYRVDFSASSGDISLFGGGGGDGGR